jgi:hypothetical protein
MPRLVPYRPDGTRRVGENLLGISFIVENFDDPMPRSRTPSRRKREAVGFTLLPVTGEHAEHAGSLPRHHGIRSIGC